MLSPVNSKARRWLSGRKQVFDRLQSFTSRTTNPIVWFHCASLGEFEQARPLLEAVRQQYPGYSILLTFCSPSGFEIQKDYTAANFVSYLPMDSQQHAQQFINLVKPCLVFWVKYEYWHFYLQQLHRTNTPLLLVSGVFRDSQPFFRRWGNFHRNMLRCFSWLFVQNEQSINLLSGIGFSEKVSVSGDTRCDRVVAIAGRGETIAAVERFVEGCRVIVAGSTWPEDEEELDHFANIHSHIKFIIAPHEIDEVHLKDIEKLFHHSIRYSRLTETGIQREMNEGNESTVIPVPNVLIIDNIGMLSRLYRYATIAYVGGGFGDDGVHNVLEAAVYNKPVVFGPVYKKFIEAVELIDAGGAFCVGNALELEETLLALLREGEEYRAAGIAAGNYVHKQTGATDRILQFIQEKRLLTN